MEEQRYQGLEGVALERLLVLSATTADDISVQEDGSPAHVFPFLPEMDRSPPQPQHSCTPTGHLPCQLPPHLSPRSDQHLPSGPPLFSRGPADLAHLPHLPCCPPDTPARHTNRGCLLSWLPLFRSPPASNGCGLLPGWSLRPSFSTQRSLWGPEAERSHTSNSQAGQWGGGGGGSTDPGARSVTSSSATPGKDHSAWGSVSPFVKRLQPQCLCSWVVVRVEASRLTPSPPPQPYATAFVKSSTI